MRTPKTQKSSIVALNSYLITALLSLFISGIFLILTGLFIFFEQYSVLISNELYQILILVLFMLGLILVSLGALESFLIMLKVKSIIKLILERSLSNLTSPHIGQKLRIIRPKMPVTDAKQEESPPIQASKQVSIAPKIVQKDIKKTVDRAETIKHNIDLDITLEEALNKILDRYNDPRVSKAFKNWQNTLMLTFPDLDTSYLFKINNDQGIILEEGYEEDVAVQVILDSDLYKKMMAKQVNPIKAYSSGGLEVKGKMKNLLKLRKLMF